MRKCAMCGESKPATGEFFSPDKRGGREFHCYCRPCLREYVRQWNKKNPSALAASQQRYRKRHKEELRKRGKEQRRAAKLNPQVPIPEKRCSRCGLTKPSAEFYAFAYESGGLFAYCKPCHAIRGREWRAKTNPEKLRKYQREWKEANREHLRRQGRERYAANREKYIQAAVEKNRRRRVRKRGAPAEVYTDEEIFVRDNWRCHICGKKVRRRDASIDHLAPVAHGGADTRDNVRLAHGTCNSKRGAGRLPAQLLLIG